VTPRPTKDDSYSASEVDEDEEHQRRSDMGRVTAFGHAWIQGVLGLHGAYTGCTASLLSHLRGGIYQVLIPLIVHLFLFIVKVYFRCVSACVY